MSCSCVDKEITEIVAQDYLPYGCDRVEASLETWRKECSAKECTGKSDNFGKYSAAHDETQKLCDELDRLISLQLAELNETQGNAVSLLATEPGPPTLEELDAQLDELIRVNLNAKNTRAKIKAKLDFNEINVLGENSRQNLEALKAFSKRLTDMEDEYRKLINKIKRLSQKQTPLVKKIRKTIFSAEMPPGKARSIYELKRAQEQYETAELLNVAKHLGIEKMPTARNDLMWTIAVRLAETTDV